MNCRLFSQHEHYTTESQIVKLIYDTDKYCKIVTIQQVVSREVFWHEYAKIPRHTSQNAITEGDFKCILTRNCEGTEQLRKIKVKLFRSAFLMFHQYYFIHADFSAFLL